MIINHVSGDKISDISTKKICAVTWLIKQFIDIWVGNNEFYYSDMSQNKTLKHHTEAINKYGETELYNEYSHSIDYQFYIIESELFQ